jgi:hypothetical protein
VVELEGHGNLNEQFRYLLDVRARGLGRPLLLTLPTLYFTWKAFRSGANWLSILALAGLWIAMVLEWRRWMSNRAA